MDKITHYDFNGFTIRELVKGKEAYQVLLDYGFIDDEVIYKRICREISRRINNVLCLKEA